MENLNIPLINCAVELILTWFKNSVLINYEIDNPENAIFQITDTKFYVPVVTLSKENDTKLLEQLKSGFKRTIKWNKYSSITVEVNKTVFFSSQNIFRSKTHQTITFN